MNEHRLTPAQQALAQKQTEWAEDAAPQGEALPPHKMNRGRAHPMRGTNSEDLTRWCIEHET